MPELDRKTDEPVTLIAECPDGSIHTLDMPHGVNFRESLYQFEAWAGDLLCYKSKNGDRIKYYIHKNDCPWLTSPQWIEDASAATKVLCEKCKLPLALPARTNRDNSLLLCKCDDYFIGTK